MKNHKDLEVRKESIALSVKCYEITEKFSNEEKFGLASQIRRSAISIASNIAEGAARSSNKEFKKSSRKPQAFKPGDEWCPERSEVNPAKPGSPKETPAFRPESFIQFLYISLSSASELDTQIEIAKRIELSDLSELESLQQKVNTISKMLQCLIRSIKNKKL